MAKYTKEEKLILEQLLLEADLPDKDPFKGKVPLYIGTAGWTAVVHDFGTFHVELKELEQVSRKLNSLRARLRGIYSTLGIKPRSEPDPTIYIHGGGNLRMAYPIMIDESIAKQLAVKYGVRPPR